MAAIAAVEAYELEGVLEILLAVEEDGFALVAARRQILLVPAPRLAGKEMVRPGHRRIRIRRAFDLAARALAEAHVAKDAHVGQTPEASEERDVPR